MAGHLLGLDILGALDAGETVGLVSTLAQPNLTALSGETADFLAGGEYPIPISQGLGSTSVEYKKYGISPSYTPTVIANGDRKSVVWGKRLYDSVDLGGVRCI